MVLEEYMTNINYLNQTKPHKGWNAAIFIIFVEVAERFAYYGMSSNLIMYLTNELGEETPTAAKNVNTWAAVTSLLPLLGAFLADSFLGRFNTILLASIIYCTGVILVSMSVSIISRHSISRKVWFFVSLYVIATGEGGHKPCALTFAADQFGEDSVEQKKTKSSFYNWWYMSTAAGATFAVFGVTFLQDKLGWGIGFGVVAGAMVVALAMFLLGINKYRREGPTGSPFTSVAQVFVAAIRKRNVDEMRDGCGVFYGNERVDTSRAKARTLARTHQFRFLDKAMIMDDLDFSAKVAKDPWRLCSQNQVEEVKLLLRLIRIWLCCLMFSAVNSFLPTYFTKQASTMTRTLGSSSFETPPASLQSVYAITILITIPIYDRIFIPIARKFTGHPSGITVLQRVVGFGLFLSVLNMVASALVEAKRVNAAREHGLLDNPKLEIPIRVWWLLPQYVIGGLSDTFAFVGLQELFYEQTPPAMRSLGSAANLSIIGVGNLISSGIISLVQVSSKYGGNYKWLDDNINRAHLDYFYWMMAVLSALNLCAYMWVANGFVYKKVRFEEVEEEEKPRLIGGNI